MTPEPTRPAANPLFPVGVHGDYHNDGWDERILAVKVFQLEQSFVSANLPYHVTQVVYKSCGVYRSARQSVLSHRPCRTEADALPFPPVFGGPVIIEVMQIASAFPFALSIVIPVYNGAESVSVLVEALSRLEVQGALEIILVNDGSPDNSLAVCRDLCGQATVPLTVVNLSRNFGEHNAVMAGLGQARGAFVITMDDDLQNPPEEVVRLWRYALHNNFDAVYTDYAEKQHAVWRNLGSRFANWCADMLIDKPKGVYLSSFRCMSAFTVRSVLAYRGPFSYIDGLIMQVTQNIGQLQVSHLPRKSGHSNYTVRRLIRLFMTMFLSFSVMPLRFTTILGISMAGIGMLDLLSVIVEALQGRTPQGWASLMVVTLLLSGVQLIMLGVLGEYLGRLFLTINNKPQFVVRDITRNDLASRLTIRSDTAEDLVRSNSQMLGEVRLDCHELRSIPNK